MLIGKKRALNLVKRENGLTIRFNFIAFIGGKENCFHVISAKTFDFELLANISRQHMNFTLVSC